MNEGRKVCVDFCHEDRKCPYAKVVKENGEYPVITFQAKVKEGVPDVTTMHNLKSRVDTICFWVYCNHPSLSKEKFIGSVEPYFSCNAPGECPELQKECKTHTSKISLLGKLKNFFRK